LIDDGPERRPHETDGNFSWTAAAILLAMLAAVAVLSQFFRASTSIIGPELIRDLGLSSQALGFANGSFFLGLLLTQVPAGVAFDRFGPRQTIAALSVPMAAGAMWHAVADSGAELAAARLLTGIGCAASFTGSVVLVARWFPHASWSMTLSWLTALSQAGLVLAGTPLALATEVVGWRFAFVAMGLVAMLVGYLFLLLVRDWPPSARPAEPGPADARGAREGLRRVLATPGLVRVLCLFMVAYAALVTVQMLWAGPYLHDVYGLDPRQRGNVLLGMAAVQVAGALLVGPMDRILNTRKWVVVASASLALAALVLLAAVEVALPVAIALLLLLCAASAYGSVLYAQIRSLFPDHLAGRGATIANMAPLLGGALLPMLTGFIPPLFASDGPGYSPLAYRAIFAMLALLLALGLAAYLTTKDAKPRQPPQLRPPTA
jgi:MFS family permease